MPSRRQSRNWIHTRRPQRQGKEEEEIAKEEDELAEEKEKNQGETKAGRAREPENREGRKTT